jgi:hypothetical protein
MLGVITLLCLSNLYRLQGLSNTTLWISFIHYTYCSLFQLTYTAIISFFFSSCASTWFCIMGSSYGTLPSHSLDTPQSIGLLWMKYEPNTETSTWQHNTHKRQTSMPPAGFKPTLPASEWLQYHASDHTATRIGCIIRRSYKFITKNVF